MHHKHALCSQVHVKVSAHSEMYRCMNSILNNIISNDQFYCAVSLRATCRRPSGSASRGWRWPGSWWRGTSIKRDWWSCRRPSGGRRWYGQSPESHSHSLKHHSSALRRLTCVLCSMQSVKRESGLDWEEKVQYLAVVSSPFSFPQSLCSISLCGLAFKLCFPPLILCPSFICFSSRM